jgi:membrane associated rhomboid family serine protease
VPHPAWIEVARSPDAREIRHRVLSLQSVGIASGILHHAGEEVLVVRDEDHARAAAELARYSAENAAWPPRESYPAPISTGMHAAIVYGGILVLLYSAQVAHRFGVDWETLGRADADRIRAGEWWRATTALFLHADLPHLAGNIVFGAALGVVLSASIGVGAAWWCALLGGTIGNYANAWMQDASHRSLGASTAVFALLGVQVAYEFVRRSELRYRPWRRWVPVIMGFGLLAWLGMGGVNVQDPESLQGLERVDIGAHGLGFAAGGILGLALARVPRRSLRTTNARQAWICAAVVAATALAWTLAVAAR